MSEGDRVTRLAEGAELAVTDRDQLRRAFGCFPSGVASVCAVADGQPIGLAASSFTAVSITPPLVSVSIQDTSQTWPRLRTRTRLGISVLAQGHDIACLSLSRKVGDRFDGVGWWQDRDGAVFLDDACAWFDCSVHAEVPAGDHAIVLLLVHRLEASPRRPPLVFHASRFHRLASI
jgi:flavin reductase (DIM6/NTAB) family NADH-FMN oxidoreductase RutF